MLLLLISPILHGKLTIIPYIIFHNKYEIISFLVFFFKNSMHFISLKNNQIQKQIMPYEMSNKEIHFPTAYLYLYLLHVLIQQILFQTLIAKGIFYLSSGLNFRCLIISDFSMFKFNFILLYFFVKH